MSREFLDEALGRLIRLGVVRADGGKLSFTEEWIKTLTRRLTYDMTKEQILESMRQALRDFYSERGYDSDVRFDLAWVKKIFSEQMRQMDEFSRSVVKNFMEAVESDD
ncbi:MAG: hypothetical protein QW767_01560 [Thermoprotei archaeon]